MATFLERAAHSVNHILPFYFDIVILVISHFGFEGGTLVLIAPVPGHCLSFPFYYIHSCKLHGRVNMVIKAILISNKPAIIIHL